MSKITQWIPIPTTDDPYKNGVILCTEEIKEYIKELEEKAWKYDELSK